MFELVRSGFRNVLNQGFHSIINIGGLAIALAACLLIIGFVQGELGYDRFIPAAERTYRIDITFRNPGRPDEVGPAYMGGYAPLLPSASADVEDVTRYELERLKVRAGDRLYMDRIAFADPNFPQFFGLIDDPNILADQSAIILTESAALKYFSTRDAVGRLMTINGDNEYVVAAVIPDLPRKSHLGMTMIAPLHQTRHAWVDNEWSSGNTFTYVRMRPGRSPESLHDVLARLIDEHMPARSDGLRPSDTRLATFVLVRDIYLKSKGGVALKPSGDISTVYRFSAAAFLILLIAGMNYANLTGARVATRAREVAIRKIHGASRVQLITQIIVESLIATFLGLVLALAFVELSAPLIGNFLGSPIALANGTSKPIGVLFLLGLATLVGGAAGAVPGAAFASIRPVRVMHDFSSSIKSSRLRQGLVFAQFAIAISLITMTWVMARQTQFARTLDLGFESHGVVLIRGIDDNKQLDQMPAIVDRLKRVPGVTGVTASQFVPSDSSEWNSYMTRPETPGQTYLINVLSHQPDFISLYKIDLLAGRTLDQTRGSDMTQAWPEPEKTVAVNALINESALRTLGFAEPDDALGRQVDWTLNEGRQFRFTVVGIIRDFHLRSLRDPLRPMIYFDFPRLFRTISVRFGSDVTQATIGDLQSAWASIAPDIPLDYEILDSTLGAFYAKETRQVQVFVGFAVLAIFISGLGILGLAAYSIERRLKEICIRRVLGAKSREVMLLLSWQFSKPIFLANLLAWPVAWYFASEWLQNFVYRIDLSAGFFLFAGAIALLIAWAVVSIYSMRVSRIRPVEILRQE